MAATSSAATASPPSIKLSLLRNPIPQARPSSLSFHSPFSSSPVSALSLSFTPKRAPVSRIPAVAEQDNAVNAGAEEEFKKALTKPCELYICNLPRNYDITELLELFKPYGTVHSVEVCRDSETGLSRGCGYVTMNSVPEARAAITALDGSDLGGREIRVKYSAQIVPGRKNPEALTSAPKLGIIFESPHKAYIGNLAWSVRPEDLRKHFTQYGTVVSARVLYDRKGGKNRVYGFLSFSSAEELKAAIGASGSEFRGRELLVREVVHKE